jgi:hypothetical protein
MRKILSGQVLMYMGELFGKVSKGRGEDLQEALSGLRTPSSHSGTAGFSRRGDLVPVERSERGG